MVFFLSNLSNLRILSNRRIPKIPSILKILNTRKIPIYLKINGITLSMRVCLRS